MSRYIPRPRYEPMHRLKREAEVSVRLNGETQVVADPIRVRAERAAHQWEVKGGYRASVLADIIAEEFEDMRGKEFLTEQPCPTDF